MSVDDYINEKKEMYTVLFDFLDSSNDPTDEYQIFLKNFKINNITDNREEFLIFLNLLSKIAKHHHRGQWFTDKLEQIILLLADKIKQTLSNQEILNFFKNNKILLYILIKNKIMRLSETILYIMEKNNEKYQYFLDFKENMKFGENDSYICELIRQDLIEEFIIYVNTINMPILKTIINPSLFETNPFLLKKEQITLIEYAAFFGSIQIFKYLIINGAELKPSLWLYAIHSNSADMIHLLEENQVKPSDETYKECYYEAIKCHHNNIAKYIHENLLIDENSQYKSEEVDEEYSIEYLLRTQRALVPDLTDNFVFHYFNFELFPDDFTCDYILYHLCLNNYYNLVKLFIESKDIDFSSYKIFKFLFF